MVNIPCRFDRSSITNKSTDLQGNATFQSFADGEAVGDLAITNLILRPGANVIPVTAHINQKTILKIVKRPAYCQNGIIPFQLKANKVENQGEEIPWLVSSLGTANQTVNVNIGAVIGSPVTNFCIQKILSQLTLAIPDDQRFYIALAEQAHMGWAY